MAGVNEAFGAAVRHLLAASHLSGPDDLPALLQLAAGELGATLGVVYVADYEQTALVPLLPESVVERQSVPVDGTLAGRAFSEVTSYEASTDDSTVVWLPVIDGAERLGVMQLVFPVAEKLDTDLRDRCLGLASMVAELVMTRSVYGDSIELARRRLPMSLPAELQWTQLPPLTFATPRVAISGILVPAHEVAGDSFDYSVNGDYAHVAIVDAMGHGLEAALLSVVAVGALRNARRAGLDLVDRVRSMDKHLTAHFGADKFVTAIVGELESSTGTWRWITAGHPPALLVRQGRVVKSLDEPINPPLGLLSGTVQVGVERLQPADRLLLHTDGVVEARNADGDFFGTARLVDLISREAAAGRPAAETLRRLNLAILGHQGGELQDDATTLLVEWLGEEQQRSTP